MDAALDRQESDKVLLDKFLHTRTFEHFEPIIQRHLKQIYRVVYRIVHNQHDAEDLVQDTMLRAYESIETFKGRAKLSTWLCQIGVNLAISFLRSRKKFVPSDAVEWQAASSDPHAHGAETQEEVERIHCAISGLSATLRSVIVLSVVEEMAIEEMAYILKRPKATIYWRLHHARRILRRKLEVGDE